MEQLNSLLSFLTKAALCPAQVKHTENRGHRLSGEEARQQDKRTHWISSWTGSQPRNSAGTDRSVQDKPTEIIIVIEFPFFGHSIGHRDFQYPKFDNITPSTSKFSNKMLHSHWEIIQHYFLHILYNLLRFSYFINKRVGLQFFSWTRCTHSKTRYTGNLLYWQHCILLGSI